MRDKKDVLLIILFSCFFITGCRSSDIINSTWTDEPPALNGNYDDWRGKTFVAQDENLMIGAQNDTNFLYMVIMTGTQSNQMQILGRGMTVWFDKTGGNDKDLGLKFPMGKTEAVMNPPFKRNEGENNSDMLNQMVNDAMAEGKLEVSGPGDSKRILYLANEKSIVINLTFNNSVLIYELKIPLSNKFDNSFNLGVNDSTSVGVGFETPEFNFDKMMPPGNGKNMPDKGNGDHRPPPGMGPPEKNISMPQQLKYWCVINLVSHKKH